VAHFKSAEAIRGCYDDAVKRMEEGTCPCRIVLGERTDVQLFYRLRPTGIDRDGWARRRGSLRVANLMAVGGIRLKLELTSPGGGVKVRTEILVNGTCVCRLVPPPLSFEIGIPLPPSGGVVKIEFLSDNDILLQNDPRRRALRICSIELVGLGTIDQLELPAAPDGAERKAKAAEKVPQKPAGKVSPLMRLGRRLRQLFSLPKE
jgi:hypothetical protein